MKKYTIAVLLMLVAFLTGCTSGDKSAFIENTSQDVELLYHGDDEVDAVRLDTSADGDKDDTMNVLLSADPKNNANALHFPDDIKPGSFGKDDYSISIKGVVVGLGEDFLPNSEKVGNARIEKSKACLESGYDIDYFYDSDKFAVYTMVKDSKQLIFNIEIRNSEYTTAKGAQIGESTRDNIYEMYGMPTDYTGTVFKYGLSENKYSLEFSFDENGKLEGIDYIDNAVM